MICPPREECRQGSANGSTSAGGSCPLTQLSLLWVVRVLALAEAPLARNSWGKASTALGEGSGQTAHDLELGKAGRACSGEQPLSY